MNEQRMNAGQVVWRGVPMTPLVHVHRYLTDAGRRRSDAAGSAPRRVRAFSAARLVRCRMLPTPARGGDRREESAH